MLTKDQIFITVGLAAGYGLLWLFMLSTFGTLGMAFMVPFTLLGVALWVYFNDYNWHYRSRR